MEIPQNTLEGLLLADTEYAPKVAVRPQDLPFGQRRAMFCLFIALQVLLNFDSGSIPASLSGRKCVNKPPSCNPDLDPGDGLLGEFRLTKAEAGMLGAYVYIGLTLTCVFAGKLLQREHVKFLLVTTMFVNTLMNFVFAVSVDLWTLLLSRIGVGISQAFLIVYIPVWVDEFAPAAYGTTWMALTQAGVPIGIMTGYVVSGLISANTNDLSWRCAFMIQVILLVPTLCVFALVPSRFTDIPTDRTKEIDDGLLSPKSKTATVPSSIAGQYRYLLCEAPIFLATSISLSALYFVVSGIQLWISLYLYGPPVRANPNAVVIAFGCTSATAPVLGVLAGGSLVDYVGGYKSIDKAALVAGTCGLCAVLPAVGAIFAQTLYQSIFFIWLILFAGGMVVPAATGIVVACVDRRLRSAAASFCILIYNVLGYCLGPMLSGYAAYWMGDDVTWAYRVTLLWSILGFVPMVFAYFWAVRDRKALEWSGTDSYAPAPSQSIPKPAVRIVQIAEDIPIIKHAVIESGVSLYNPTSYSFQPKTLMPTTVRQAAVTL